MAVVDLRYARALAAVLSDQKLDLIAAQGQLNDFANILEESVELREVLNNPSIPEPQKLKVLDALAPRLGLSGPVRNFIAVITHHQRLHQLRDMITAYAGIADEDTGIAEAEIITARPLDEANRRLLEQQVAKLAGEPRVQATYREDPSLLGGAIVKLGSTVYDGSIRAQLEQMRQRLASAGA
ncbi:MAG TPA: ATP synthase F1 subunit delta [Candidatus Aquilonibacter sp.]|nr:ATP synthase F1 subunit delta [Candidatus Aquilonibacter sp.]